MDRVIDVPLCLSSGLFRSLTLTLCALYLPLLPPTKHARARTHTHTHTHTQAAFSGLLLPALTRRGWSDVAIFQLGVMTKGVGLRVLIGVWVLFGVSVSVVVVVVVVDLSLFRFTPWCAPSLPPSLPLPPVHSLPPWQEPWRLQHVRVRLQWDKPSR